MNATAINRRERCSTCDAEWWSAPHGSGTIHPKDHCAPDGSPCPDARFRWRGLGDYTAEELVAVAAADWAKQTADAAMACDRWGLQRAR